MCDHLRQRGFEKGLLMMSVIHILIGSHYRATASRRLRASIQ